MKGKKNAVSMKALLRERMLILILILLCSSPLWAQKENDTELTETEKQQLATEAHEQTGIQIYYQYILPLHIPGWAFSSREYDLGSFDLPMVGINISYFNVTLGIDMDFGTPKPILKDMGIGMALEWNVLADLNMDDYDATLFQSYAYLFHHEKTKRFADYYFKLGFGRASFSNSKALDVEDSDGEPSGPMVITEIGSVYPDMGRFRISSGISYKFISIYTKNMHLIGPYVRVSYLF